MQILRYYNVAKKIHYFLSRGFTNQLKIFVSSYTMLMDAVTVYPMPVPIRFANWANPQNRYLRPPGNKHTQRLQSINATINFKRK